MKLSVHLVAWNGAKYIPYLFESVRKQNFRDWFFYVIDNDSKDNTVDLIKKELENFSVQYKLIQNQTNVGFAIGHNQAFHDTESEYFLLLNQDMYLAPDCLGKMVNFLDCRPKAAAVSPRLMKWDFAKAMENLPASFSDQIDALGLRIFRNRRVVEWMTQEKWSDSVIWKTGFTKKHSVKNHLNLADQDDSSGAAIEVFGVSGAFSMYRRSSINDVLLPGGQFLDESYHSYKEDVDIAYRLKQVGTKAFVLLDTIAYHDRAGAGPKENSDTAAAANKQKQSDWVRYHSYKNHLMTLYKNEYWQNFALDFPWILWYELKKLVYFILFDRKALSGLKEIWLLRKELRAKRKYIKKLRQVSWREMRERWI